MGVRLPPRAPSLFLRCYPPMNSSCCKAFLRRTFSAVWSFGLIGAVACLLSFSSGMLAQQSPASSAYLGFDLNTYPGDDALPILRKTFSFGGYWLNPPPGAKQNDWTGKRQLLLAHKFGFLLLYNGPLGADLKSPSQASKRGITDATNDAVAAKKEGFP